MTATHSPEIIVYSKPQCQACRLTKKWLTDRGLPFTEADILLPENLALAKENGIAAAPMTEITLRDDRGNSSTAYVGGFNITSFEALLRHCFRPNSAQNAPASAEVKAAVLRRANRHRRERADGMSAPLPPLLLRGDCLDELRRIPAESVHAVVTDPPYGLANTDPKHANKALARWSSGDRAFVPEGRGFMGEAWDSFVPPPAVWDEVMRILLPGGHLLAFAGTRTFDLMGVSIRLAGFEIRDSVAWLYGQGFPKSMDVSKAIDKAVGVERESLGRRNGAATANTSSMGSFASEYDETRPATDAAREWEGWGTALKPAFEPIVVARKPFAGTVAANVLEHGVGALNIDATRIGGESTRRRNSAEMGYHGGNASTDYETESDLGRWPANVALDESQAAELDRQAPSTGAAAKASGPSRSGKSSSAARGMFAGTDGDAPFHADKGGASRFFYVPKAPKSERPVVSGVAHSTVKPLALMRWLIRLVTPPGGCVVDPFAGSGTTLEAAYLEGFESIGVEVTPKYWPLIETRIQRVTERPGHAED